MTRLATACVPETALCVGVAQLACPLRVLAMVSCLALVQGLLLSGPANAQPQRDPTMPPPSVAQPESAAVATPSLDTRALAVVVRGGVSHLVVGTRLYAVGQQVGAAKIERISETEVWLRENGTLTKLPLFAGIDRHPTTTPSKQHKAAGVVKPAQPKP